MKGCVHIGFSLFFEIDFMTKVSPFKAIRPTRDKVHLVASRPFYTYEKSILKAKLKDNPFTFLHIINPEFGNKITTEPNSIERFKKVRAVYETFLNDGILIQEEEPSFYLYRQTQNGHSFTGIIGGSAISDYNNDVIKKHEETLTAREQMFAKYLETVQFNAEPVLLIHPENKELKKIFNVITETRGEYEFTTTDKITHELWVINDTQQIQDIQRCYDSMKNVYIADGHHRSSSSSIYSKKMEEKYPNAKEDAPFKSFLTYSIPESEVEIIAFNRLVKDLNGLSHENFVKALEKGFVVNKLKKEKVPDAKHHFTMFLDNTWYELVVKDENISDDPVKAIDAEILTRLVLDPILDIHDLKTDSRIDFLNAKDGVKGLKKKIKQGKARVGFALYEVEVKDLIAIANNNGIMPPKSTWIEPKLRSGLTIYSLEHD